MAMDFAALPQNLTRVREKIASIQTREGLRDDVRIVAVTKGHSGAAVAAAHMAGVLDVGENRVQEALGKQDSLGDLDLRWHLIGHLQTNKTKLVAGRFSLVHSIDSVRLAEALQRSMERLGDGLDLIEVLVQVNVAQEPQKSGCELGAVPEIASKVEELPRLRLRGLMTMAPYTDNEIDQRKVFARLREQRDGLVASGMDVPELSMGMSGDYESAVAEGATILRLGTVLFGERPK